MSNNTNPAWVEDPIAPAVPVAPTAPATPAAPTTPAAPIVPVIASGSPKLPAKPPVPVTTGSPCILALGGQQMPSKAEVDWLASLTPDFNPRYSRDDIGTSLLFADFSKPIARYVAESKQWYNYRDGIWVPDTGNLMTTELCKRLVAGLLIYSTSITDDKQRTEYQKFVSCLNRRNNREKILKDATSIHFISMSDFDRNPYLLNCQNGTLDLKAGVFRPHNPHDLLTKMAAVRYDPNAICLRWEQFIDEVTQGDVELAIYLQKALGYSLTGDTRHECFFVLYGPLSRNGKSTTLETILKLMGSYGKSVDAETLALKSSTNSNAANEDIARLAGARFVNASEPAKKMELSSAQVKKLTGNNTIKAREFYKSSFEYIPQYKIFIDTNYLPEVRDNTLFTSDRVRVIPFNRHFSEKERDKTLKTQLTAPDSLSGILNWCVKGYNLMLSDGFEAPPAVTTATMDYRIDSDKMARFLSEQMIADGSAEVKNKDAYTEYQLWCGRNGFKAGSIKTFKAEISKYASIERRRPKDGGEKATLICGYCGTP